MKITLINGEAGAIPASHRALAYGDGLFETIYVDHNGPQFLTDHLNRLLSGVEILNLAWSESCTDKLLNEISRLVRDITVPHALKIMLLRNYPGRGYDFDPQQQTTDVVLQLADYVKPAWAEKGAKVVVAETYINENQTLAGLKHLNRLDSVIARQFARKNNAHEALLSDAQKNIIEGSMCNVFFKVGSEWLTPSLKVAGVAGILRQQVIEQNAVQVREIHRDELANVEAAALTNSLIGMVPVVSIDNRILSEKVDLNYNWNL
ncbi:aminodeoxychorismate lyase [Reinekea marinisedimentorum]|uniref:Aminodeoxychorismate lyase n=1 Tax=Reinekea marinisedimentorum TaxID=230495 RepID=A0A4R3ID30_9GAMM|nr:aminodeoxychorismate lyase [Reinekea marinisedimentorum]TCS42555.1 4-amino-4-deoxychorismate lyase [Reinekea marinisedimentorum]